MAAVAHVHEFEAHRSVLIKLCDSADDYGIDAEFAADFLRVPFLLPVAATSTERHDRQLRHFLRKIVGEMFGNAVAEESERGAAARVDKRKDGERRATWAFSKRRASFMICCSSPRKRICRAKYLS